MSEKVKIRYVKPADIEIPPIRITSSWDPDLLEMFRRSVASMGVKEPIMCVEEADKIILVDGLHRLDEAKRQNVDRIPIAVIQGTMRDVMLQNLVLNRLRGKTKASEMVKVIGSLQSDYNMDIDSLVENTGLKRDYIEKMLQVRSASSRVLDALDQEEIGVGQAYELSRIPDKADQETMLEQVRQFRITASDLKDIVDASLKIRAERAATPVPQAGPPPLPTRMIKCHICEQPAPINRVTGINICIDCYGAAMDYVKRQLGRGPPPLPEAEGASNRTPERTEPNS